MLLISDDDICVDRLNG